MHRPDGTGISRGTQSASAFWRGLMSQSRRLLGPLVLHSEWQLVALAAAFGAGAAFYVAGPLPLVPLRWMVCLAAGCGLLLLLQAFRHSIAARLLVALIMGAVMAAFRVSLGTAPIVQSDTYVRVQAVVERLEVRTDRPPRLLLAPLHFSPTRVKLPPHIRLVVRTSMPPGLVPGDHVALPAILSRPEGPVVPGGYDYARDAYFVGVGATGYATGTVARIGKPTAPTLAARLQRLRLRIADRLTAAIPGQAGALASALTVGYRNTLNDDTDRTLRRAGLSHLLAISGLHMGLVTAAAFFFLEYLVAAVPAVALRMRPKKLAAVGAWGVAVGYLLLSGAAITTIRAFVMVSVALLAVLLDRRVLSLRSVALAALFIMVLWPEAVLGIGFQMSFAATAVLVAFYEYGARQGWLKAGERPDGMPGRLGRFLRATLMTTFVAQLAVAPFALYHFQSVSLIGVVANLVIVPIVSLVVMPLALLNLCLMPLGLDVLVSPLLGASLSAVLDIAHLFAAAPMAVLRVGAPDKLFIIGVALALVAGLVLRGRWLMLPFAGMLATLVLMLPARQADVMIAKGGRVIATHDATHSRMAVVGGRRDSFRDMRWQQYWGLDPLAESEELPRRCDVEGCRTTVGQRHISYVKTIEAMREACGAGDIVILNWRWRRYCRGAALLLTDEDLSEKGPAALFWAADASGSDGVTLSWANPPQRRPWHPRPWWDKTATHAR